VAITRYFAVDETESGTEAEVDDSEDAHDIEHFRNRVLVGISEFFI
jgi:hypothetical protein